LPAVVGYLLVGLLVSPFTPGYVANRGHIELLANIGVVLLLFEVGIEVDPIKVRRESGYLLWAAPLQTVLTAGLTAAVFIAFGMGTNAALLLGLAVAFSSSVVVVNITRSRRRTTNEATEEAMVGWSVLQDLTGVLLTAIALAIIGFQSRTPAAILLGLLGFGLIALAAAWLLPRVLQRVVGEGDLFLMLSVGAGLALAGIGATFFGVPLALAAFLAGLAVAESPVAAEARRQLLPFRDLFAVMFFVAIGTLIDPNHLAGALPWLGLAVGCLIVFKSSVIYVLARLIRPAAVRPMQLAIGLGQVGEFSFVVGSIGVAAGIIDPAAYSGLLLTMVVTICLSAVLVRVAHRGPARPREGIVA
jgi:CPA2 family monovalent cation:H+ antiporter-2